MRDHNPLCVNGILQQTPRGASAQTPPPLAVSQAITTKSVAILLFSERFKVGQLATELRGKRGPAARPEKLGAGIYNTTAVGKRVDSFTAEPTERCPRGSGFAIIGI